MAVYFLFLKNKQIETVNEMNLLIKSLKMLENDCS